jgi:mono/diheme cytochrome c family protein
MNLRTERGALVAALFIGAILLAGLSVWTAATPDDESEKGRYLAMQVAMCVECHSPRDARGRLVQSRLFQGAPIPMEAPAGFPRWAFQAPSIAGLPGWRESDAVFLLMHGRRPDGKVPQAPMPSYRMKEEDARAVARFLKSLGEN